MKPSDEWIMEHLPGTAPEMAAEWMREQDIPLTRERYLNIRTSIRNRLKVMEKYRMIEWTGIYTMITNTAAKYYTKVI